MPMRVVVVVKVMVCTAANQTDDQGKPLLLLDKVLEEG